MGTTDPFKGGTAEEVWVAALRKDHSAGVLVDGVVHRSEAEEGKSEEGGEICVV